MSSLLPYAAYRLPRKRPVGLSQLLDRRARIAARPEHTEERFLYFGGIGIARVNHRPIRYAILERAVKNTSRRIDADRPRACPIGHGPRERLPSSAAAATTRCCRVEPRSWRGTGRNLEGEVAEA